MNFTKLSQETPAPQPQRTPPRNNEAIAQALVDSAAQLGLDAFLLQTGQAGEATSFSVVCNGRNMRMAQAGGPPVPDIQIIFDIPYFGCMTGSVIHGMENGPADHVMRKIVSGAVRGSGIVAQQQGRVVNQEQCMGGRAAQAAPAPMATQGVPNGMA